VDETVDGGKILLQKAVEVRENDTPETLQRRVSRKPNGFAAPRDARALR
jgi:phosphoribosylglycinamide formyltransferase-1